MLLLYLGRCPAADVMSRHKSKTPNQRNTRGAVMRRAPLSRHHRAPRPSSLSPELLQKRADALAAHADMLRNTRLSASEAAKDHSVTIRDLWKYIPKAFKKDKSGRIRAVADRYIRRMEIHGPNGPELIKVRGSKARNEVARYRNDVFRFQAGDLAALDRWDGVTIQGHKLFTDRKILLAQAEQDNLPEHFGSEQVIPYSGGAA